MIPLQSTAASESINDSGAASSKTSSRILDEEQPQHNRLTLSARRVLVSALGYAHAEMEEVTIRGTAVIRTLSSFLIKRIVLFFLALVCCVLASVAIGTLIVETTPHVPASLTLTVLTLLSASLIFFLLRKKAAHTELSPHSNTGIDTESSNIKEAHSKTACAREIFTDRAVVLADQYHQSFLSPARGRETPARSSGALLVMRISLRVLKLLLRAHPMVIVVAVIGGMTLLRKIFRQMAKQKSKVPQKEAGISANADGEEKSFQEKNEDAQQTAINVIAFTSQIYQLLAGKKRPALHELLHLSTTCLAIINEINDKKRSPP